MRQVIGMAYGIQIVLEDKAPEIPIECFEKFAEYRYFEKRANALSEKIKGALGDMLLIPSMTATYSEGRGDG